MGKRVYPTGRLCRCGCGQPAKKNVGPDGRNRGWYKYAEGHQPPRPFCSAAVRAKAHRSSYNRLPVGSRRIHEVKGKQYWVVKVADRRRWQLEHRVVMSQVLGRPLLRSEHVHHKDNDGLNNDPDNLQVVSGSEHRKIHNIESPAPTCTCVCPGCGASLTHFKKLGKRAKS